MKNYKVPSESTAGLIYNVTISENGSSCDCPAIGECKHIRKAEKAFRGETDNEVELLVDGPFLKALRADTSYRLELEICGDGREGIPQAEAVNKLLSWQGCVIKLTARLKD
jgi:hypothetical protein